jgi:hypothetical protein
MTFKLAAFRDLSRSTPSAKAAVSRGVAYLKKALRRCELSEWDLDDWEGNVHWLLRRDLPYSIQKTTIPGTQVLVNREYKPIGSTDPKFEIYEHYPNLHVTLTVPQLRAFCVGSQGYLFNDESAPWRGPTEAEAYVGLATTLLSMISARKIGPHHLRPDLGLGHWNRNRA